MKLHFLWILILAILSLSPGGREKAAFKHHYRGTILYANGSYGRASSHFEKAFKLAPDNFNFGLSYALSLSRTSRISKAMRVLRKNDQRLPFSDPFYDQKKLYPNL